MLSIMVLISFLIKYAVMFLSADGVTNVYVSLNRFFIVLRVLSPTAVCRPHKLQEEEIFQIKAIL